MDSDSQPFVSIVTPLFNTEKYLGECIQSVIAQTYDNWEYVIVNNFSTDKSLEIAQQHSQKDSRIRIHNNAKFLSQFENWNHALRQISSKSKYCKIVHADDWLFRECIARMVEIAETKPSVGIVSAYRLDEDKINLTGLSYKKTIFSGRDICRKTLLHDLYVFGSPSSLLLRSDLIHRRSKFYSESSIHADKEACFEILKNTDFGFVHQVLTYTRRHNDSVTSKNQNLNTHKLGKIKVLKKYGNIFLSDKEYEVRLNNLIDNYHRFLARSILEIKTKKFWNYHRNGLKEIGIQINKIKLVTGFIKELLNIRDSVKRVRSAINTRRSEPW
jgi:glycosyltransferase involved in cell wall biosynthesis